ncbi:RNA degradosome polyphosphate kinase [Micromonospora aurantiaca]|uniref:Polyphosphate kinase n=2 Tax=Micromonospora aurantiaca (nom. illeg.) TaxID=47850 RepID=A0A1C6SYV0_9ACTN|nr:Polyphosphate kinase [Micromonospora aurantiaca ATCC 27029]AXH91051.1 RNA degradosome polyphosphate kinase [Micromonospora aurantiaca]OHX03798.1 RNA degradosome polyphosphate kinase [Micromonospora sp. WMMB235]KAB1104876.1 RNA degradosome polyphosphate kinase [Micromonospora aurantiaca]RNH99248.1 RNA degradosome polyphosphate kinase [Micromonospora aurantiaca]
MVSTPREHPDGPPPILDPGTPRNGRPTRGPDGRFRQTRPPEERLGADPDAAGATGLDEPLDPVEGPGPAGETAADAGPPTAPPLPEDRFLNRELSWLDFNARVLALAEDPRTPLLERAKFLAIFASNLDEFYMVRVAGLKRRLSAGLPVRGGDRLPLRTQLDLITEKAAGLVARHATCLVDDVLPKLAAEDIRILRWSDLDDAERERLRTWFREHIFPVLTPLAVDPAHPFPYISGRSLNLAVSVRDPDGGSELFARVKVPNNVPRFVRVHRDQQGVRFLPVEDLISVHLGQLFSGMQVVECHLFRVTRNAEVEVDEDRDEDLLQALERELARRRFGPPVRLEVAASISDHMLELLVRELDMDGHDVLRVRGLLDLSALWQVYGEADRPDLKDPSFVPATHPRLAEGEVPRSVFATLRDGDVLVHHPYHSFATSVQRFVEQAAADPNVLAIKQTLYRTSGDSPIVDALVDAAAAGKQVVVLVELKARFDEVANIGWARTLERAGCHVVYGLVGLKTHCKTALVVRQEGNQIRRYCHIGTGNYHPKTARLYEDFGMLTADPEIGADLTDLFNVLTGYSRQTAFRRLLVAPQGIRSGLIERIDREIEHVRLGMPGLVQFKVNSLVDEEITDALYRASRAGVHVDLLIRGMCTLRPGVPGLSENIRVRSILGRFLEHSRIFRFGNNGDAEFWMGSADLMHRNLDRRVEALVQVSDPVARAELDHVLTAAFDPDVDAFELAADGTWHRRTGDGDVRLTHLQDLLLRRVGGRAD